MNKNELINKIYNKEFSNFSKIFYLHLNSQKNLKILGSNEEYLEKEILMLTSVFFKINSYLIGIKYEISKEIIEKNLINSKKKLRKKYMLEKKNVNNLKSLNESYKLSLKKLELASKKELEELNFGKTNKNRVIDLINYIEENSNQLFSSDFSYYLNITETLIRHQIAHGFINIHPFIMDYEKFFILLHNKNKWLENLEEQNLQVFNVMNFTEKISETDYYNSLYYNNDYTYISDSRNGRTFIQKLSQEKLLDKPKIIKADIILHKQKIFNHELNKSSKVNDFIMFEKSSIKRMSIKNIIKMNIEKSKSIFVSIMSEKIKIAEKYKGKKYNEYFRKIIFNIFGIVYDIDYYSIIKNNDKKRLYEIKYKLNDSVNIINKVINKNEFSNLVKSIININNENEIKNKIANFIFNENKMKIKKIKNEINNLTIKNEINLEKLFDDIIEKDIKRFLIYLFDEKKFYPKRIKCIHSTFFDKENIVINSENLFNLFNKEIEILKQKMIIKNENTFWNFLLKDLIKREENSFLSLLFEINLNHIQKEEEFEKFKDKITRKNVKLLFLKDNSFYIFCRINFYKIDRDSKKLEKIGKSIKEVLCFIQKKMGKEKIIENQSFSRGIEEKDFCLEYEFFEHELEKKYEEFLVNEKIVNYK